MENPHQKSILSNFFKKKKKNILLLDRWDNTLFELRETESTPFEEIANALFFKVEK